MAQAVPLIIGVVSTALPVAVQYLTAPKTRPNPIDVGKFDDIRITGSEYGTIIPRWWGTVRTGGNVIWSNGVKHQIVDYPSEGGKGTPAAPSQRVHVYTTSLGWSIGRSRVNKWGRVWADEQIIIGAVGDNIKTFEAENTTYATPGGTENTDWFRTASYVEFFKLGSLLFNVQSCELPPLPISGDADEENAPTVSPITKCDIFYRNVNGPQSNIVQIVTDTGAIVETVDNLLFQNGTSNYAVRSFTFDGDLETIDIQMDGTGFPNSSSRLRIDKIVVRKEWRVLGEQASADFTGNITGFADPDNILDNIGDDFSGYYNYIPTADANGTTQVSNAIIAESFRLYSGTETQLQDSYLIDYLNARYGSAVGSSYAPGHRGISWIGFRNYGLRRGRVPNFTAEVTNDDKDVNDILTALAGDVGLVAGDLGLTATSALEVYGYLDAGKTSRLQNWANLAQYFGFTFSEIDGKITTVLDTFTPIVSFSADSIRARAYGDQPKNYDAEITRISAAEIPREVRFSTLNPILDYLNETAIANVIEGVSSSDSVEFNFPIVANTDESRKQAERMLLKMHSETRSVSFNGMPELMRYTVGDVVSVPLNGETYTVRIDKKTSAMPLGVVEFEGTILDPYEAADVSTAIKATDLAPIASFQSAFLQPPRNAVAVPIISLPIRSEDKGVLGVYVAVSPFGVGNAESVSLYQEIADETYNLRQIYEVPSVVGEAPTALGSHADANVEDTVNDLEISFYNEESLESVTAAELDANPLLNLIRVGDEWVQFRTATLETLTNRERYRSKWTVSNLRRGRFGTAGKMSTHAANENVTLVTNNLRFFPLSESDIGKTVTFKAVSAGASLDDAKAVSFTFNPLSAYNVTSATTDRSFDANNTTIHELADVVGTIIDDLKL